jgi:hypothetical protein
MNGFGLLVITDATDQIAHPRDKAYLRNRGRSRTRFWKHVADLRDLAFRPLRRGELFEAERCPASPNGGVADSLDEAKAAFRAAASAFAEKSGPDMLNLSLSVDDPSLTLRSRRCGPLMRVSRAHQVRSGAG